MPLRSLVLAAALVGLTVPAQAAPFCLGSPPGVHISFGVSVGGTFTESEINEFDLMRLRQKGVDATRVERWSGCIRAFVRKPGGGEEMQFFDPRTFERVY